MVIEAGIVDIIYIYYRRVKLSILSQLLSYFIILMIKFNAIIPVIRVRYVV
ncbi:hypothetical protein BLA29_013109 [Euroglyphus maynei]|uniref:Uncharacterized protein n=1 Tax=Euroglyphus maynei TaxID=6958 RepID=A0A1Y3AZJ8_EURMA|nr:hypothetical protein BLA29_013109 [Euroglyphus maynei]